MFAASTTSALTLDGTSSADNTLDAEMLRQLAEFKQAAADAELAEQLRQEVDYPEAPALTPQLEQCALSGHPMSVQHRGAIQRRRNRGARGK